MTRPGFGAVTAAGPKDRRDLFLRTARRLGTPVANVEKDFWVCWTLDQLFAGRPSGAPRLLFKGGTSLSKAFDLIKRFSEDIDIVAFRDDLGQTITIDELEALSPSQRARRLRAIRRVCREYVSGPLLRLLTERLAEVTKGDGRVDIDTDAPDGQTLLIHYPSVETEASTYIRPAVKLEAGARSATDPNRDMVVRPYVASELAQLDFSVAVTTIEPTRTFWDKVVLVQNLRRSFDATGELHRDGQRVSRHYYDLHCLLEQGVGDAAFEDRALGADCARHAKLFFGREPDGGNSASETGSLAIVPATGMTALLKRDYDLMAGMIFGSPPEFSDVLRSLDAIDDLNRRR